MVSDMFSSHDSRYKCYLKKNESNMTRNVPFVIHTMKVFTISYGLFWSMFQTVVNKKCISVTNMKLKEDCTVW